MRLPLLLLITFFIVPTGYAQNLDEGSIRAYYAQMLEIYSRDNMDTQELVDFYEEHYSNDLQYRINMNANVFPEPQILEMDKPQILKMTLDTAGSMRDMKTSLDIKAINVDPQSNKAIVDYYLQHDGRVRQTSPQGQSVDVDYTSTSGCSEALAIEAGQIVVTRGQCNMQVQYALPQINEQSL